MVLANALVPSSLVPPRDGFSVDGVFSLLIDIVVDDAQVVFKNIVTHENATNRAGSHSRERDGRLAEAFSAVWRRDVPYSPGLLRITAFLAEFWDEVPPALEAVRRSVAWSPAEVSAVVDVGLWYAYAFRCAPGSWCDTRPGSAGRFSADLEAALPSIEAFCSRQGRAKALGCAVVSFAHCTEMRGALWSRTSGLLREALAQRATRLLRFVDLWSLTSALPGECIEGHQTPMSAWWSWQALLGGICQAHAAPGAALFRGSTCTAARAAVVCPDFAAHGFRFEWECAAAQPCHMVLRSSTPRGGASGRAGHWPTVRVDFPAASATGSGDVCMGCGLLGAALPAAAMCAASLLLLRSYAGPRGREARYEPLAAEEEPPPGPGAGLSSAARRRSAAEAGEPERFALGLARGIASSHVVLGHLYAAGALGGPRWLGWGCTWVPWFFLVSGFVLFSAEAGRPRQEAALEYLRRRVADVYPLYGGSLLLAMAIAKTRGGSPGLRVLLLEAWLGQAWIPSMTEQALQMQCWFLSCLVPYWACFPSLFAAVQRLKLSALLGAICVSCAIPWAVAVLASACSFDGYDRHTFGRTSSADDLVVVLLKFHPLCYLHVFVLGMLLGRVRVLMKPSASAKAMKLLLHVLAPIGYVGLALAFCAPVVWLPMPALAMRLTVLLPLQAAIVLGLAGLPGAPRTLAALLVWRANCVEDYAYPAYLMQFICYHLWPADEVGAGFFAFLGSAAVISSHAWRPLEGLLRRHPERVWLAPVAVSLALCLLHALPDAGDGLPAFHRLEDLVVDVRLPIEHPTAGALINPSLLLRRRIGAGGWEVIIAARDHSVTTERVPGVRDGAAAVTVLRQTWHSEVVLGATVLREPAWEAWLAGGEALEFPLRPWSGLRGASGVPWRRLCARERLEGNGTVVRLEVTGPEDAKLLEYGAPGMPHRLALVFNSYPLRGERCENVVSQMYMALDVDPALAGRPRTAVRLQCGRRDRAEKNWIPFVHAGRLHFVYSILPHHVVHVHSDGTCGARHVSTFEPLRRLQARRPELALRGSATALLVDDPEATPSLPRAHYLALLHIVDTESRRYAHFAYRFSADAPFEVLQVSEQLPLRAAPARGSGGGSPFAFASGLARLHEKVLITYGAGDWDPRMLVLPLQRLDLMFASEDRAARALALEW